MNAHDINIRDPFILPDGGKYYLYGSRGQELWGACTGLDVYVSEDLTEWSAPIPAFERPADFWADRNFWAPEVHKFNGKYYMFATFKSESRHRGTQILRADSPLGPFLPHSDGPVTPQEWSCLDGTLYVEDGVPYMIFCHEWTQIRDGEMCCVPLTADLSAPAGEVRILFKASSLPSGSDRVNDGFITDGPFLYRTKSGRLLMIWSSFDEKGYVEAVSFSESGSVLGPWRHCEAPLSAEDGGHGMLFTDKDGTLCFTMHSPNHPRCAERVRIFPMRETEAEPFLEFV